MSWSPSPSTTAAVPRLLHHLGSASSLSQASRAFWSSLRTVALLAGEGVQLAEIGCQIVKPQYLAER